MSAVPKPWKFNTRLVLTVASAVCSAGTGQIVALDPNSFALRVLGVILSLVAVGCIAALGFFKEALTPDTSTPPTT